MPLLIVPLLILALLAIWALLLPVLLVQRYRLGKLRRRAHGWMVRGNARLLVFSAISFLLGAWIAQRWVPMALPAAALGVALGVLLGELGLRRSHFELTPKGLYYTPDRWLVLVLTIAVALRIALGVWHLWTGLRASEPGAGLFAGHADLFAVGGLLLGYYLRYTRGLRARLPDERRPRR